MLGDRAACEQALEQAEALFAARTESDAAIDCYSPAQSSRMAGSCYLSLGLPGRAEAVLTETARVVTEDEKVSALVLGNLGLAHIRQGQVDAAVTVLHSAIDVLEGTWGGGGLAVVSRAGRELGPWRAEAPVRELHDRMLGLLAPA